ncbi:MAG TPA: dihydrolipoamide acetyltransferase family protein [Burkholderiaceae bacterium]|nr:dihydrolipoamide acetyltransferase family protein [Burkholderiaceae bacterium]
MSVQVIKVPDLGEGIAQVELVAWHVKPGDPVAEDQALADVMTDKATVEIPSPVAGQVVGLGGEVGQVLAVGAELIRIERLPSYAPGGATEGRPSEARSAKQGDGVPLTPIPLREADGLSSPLAREALPAKSPLAREAGEGPGERVAASAPPRAGQRPIASPAVRARAWQLGVDLNEVPASGPGGRILQTDLDAYVARAAPPAPAAARPAPRLESGATREVRIVGLRRMIAQKMQESKRRIPHYTYVEEVDVTELEALRTELNAKWGAQRGHLTLLPFLVLAIVRAVREFPQVNARFDDEAGVVTEFDAVHMGIATQTDAGLMVPVVRDAQARDLWSCAAEVGRLAAAARSGKAVRDELSGSTITITSLGRLGGIVSTPVINHPEVAIVGVNRIATRPAIVNGTVAARQVMNLSSSFDHRVIDGALAAGFVQCVRGAVERPATLFIP